MEFTEEQYTEMIEELQKQAQSFRLLDCLRGKKYYALNLGCVILMVEKLPSTYEPCPCGSDAKYKFCCRQFNLDLK
jgi:hypothetical protein